MSGYLKLHLSMIRNEYIADCGWKIC